MMRRSFQAPPFDVFLVLLNKKSLNKQSLIKGFEPNQKFLRWLIR